MAEQVPPPLQNSSLGSSLAEQQPEQSKMPPDLEPPPFPDSNLEPPPFPEPMVEPPPLLETAEPSLLRATREIFAEPPPFPELQPPPIAGGGPLVESSMQSPVVLPMAGGASIQDTVLVPPSLPEVRTITPFLKHGVTQPVEVVRHGRQPRLSIAAFIAVGFLLLGLLLVIPPATLLSIFPMLLSYGLATAALKSSSTRSLHPVSRVLAITCRTVSLTVIIGVCLFIMLVMWLGYRSIQDLIYQWSDSLELVHEIVALLASIWNYFTGHH